MTQTNIQITDAETAPAVGEATGGAILAGWPWALAALVAIALPWLFYDYAEGRHSGFVISMASLMGIMMIFAMSYNILLGQTGLLSFGHAVYYGIGAYSAIHVINYMSDGHPFWSLMPMELLPIVGGIGGALIGMAIGPLMAPHRAVAFAMITMGIGELVTQAAITFQSFFGGENGISAWRDEGWSLVGATYGPDIEVYYLIVAWLIIAVFGMYLLTRTPLGQMANATRDNFERAQFVGYDYRRIRYYNIICSAFFAGIAGALFAVNAETVTFDTVNAITSANALLMAFIGGVGVFFGPLIGTVVVILFQTWIGGLSSAWMVYIGVLFIAMVMYAPGGIAGIIVGHRRYWQAGLMGRLAMPYLRMGAAALVLLAGFVTLIEILAYITIGQAQSKPLYLLWMTIATPDDPDLTAMPWIAALVLIAVGYGLVMSQMKPLLTAIEFVDDKIKQKEAGL